VEQVEQQLVVVVQVQVVHQDLVEMVIHPQVAAAAVAVLMVAVVVVLVVPVSSSSHILHKHSQKTYKRGFRPSFFVSERGVVQSVPIV
jgi:hypothetical protein